MKNIKLILRKIDEKLGQEYTGKIVAIELESGDYFIGDNVMGAYIKAIKVYPNKEFIFKRVGFVHTHFVGSL